MTAFDDGYSIHEGVFERDEMTRVLEALDGDDLSRTKAGARHVLAVPAVRTLASDPRLLDIAARRRGGRTVLRDVVRQIRCLQLAGRLAPGHGASDL